VTAHRRDRRALVKSISLVGDEAAVARLVAAEAVPPPRRLAVCSVRRPRDIGAVVLSWHDDRADADRFSAGLRDDGPCETVLVEERSAIGDDWLVHRWVTAADEPTLLLIGLIQRAPHLSRDSFASYWWSTHRPLANRLVPAELNPHAYVHNYVLADQPSPWDGIGELYEQSLHVASQRGEWFESEAAEPLTQDEDRFMISSTRQVLVADHRILIG
jgi:hypothetical protein